MKDTKPFWRAATLVLAFVVAWNMIPPMRRARAVNASPQDMIDMMVVTGAAKAAAVSYSANTSTQITGALVSGTCYRVSCTTDVTYRITSGTSTAATGDALLPAKTVEKFCTDTVSNVTDLTVINSAAGTCTVNLLATPN